MMVIYPQLSYGHMTIVEQSSNLSRLRTRPNLDRLRTRPNLDW
nr:MAG TPA: hypothetical protein [Caudoviricetes sp.]